MRKEIISMRAVSKDYSPRNDFGSTLRSLWRRSPSSSCAVALQDISLCVREATSLGVVGRNGSGKSTLLRILARVIQPSGGEVAVRGKVAALLELGAGIDPRFSGRENARMLGLMAGATRREIDRRLESICEFSGLGSTFEKQMRSYSSGMVLRLAFSVAVHSEPDLLLVDEVLAVGDAFFQQRCLHRIRQLQRGGCSIVLVSHDPSAILGFCDEAIWLEHGRVVSSGEPARVVSEYLGAGYSGRVDLEEDLLLRHEVPARNEIEPSRLGLVSEGTLEAAATLPNVDARYGDGRAQIEGVELRDEEGASVRSIHPGDRLRLIVTVRAGEEIPRPLIGFTVRNRLGEIIAATNTGIEGRPLPALKAGCRLSVEFGLPWPAFSSGMFSFSPAIADGTLDVHQMLDWVDNALVVENIDPVGRYGWLRLTDVGVRAELHGADSQ